MDERGADPLLVWCLGTFHATVLLAILLLIGHAAGALGGLLAGLDTLAGIALFVVLWATTLWTNHRLLADVPILSSKTTGWQVAKSGIAWGGINGVLFVLALIAVFVIGEIGPSTRFTLDAILGAAGSIALVAAIGSLFASVVGALIGALFATIDVALVRVAADSVPDGGSAPERL